MKHPQGTETSKNRGFQPKKNPALKLCSLKNQNMGGFPFLHFMRRFLHTLEIIGDQGSLNPQPPPPKKQSKEPAEVPFCSTQGLISVPTKNMSLKINITWRIIPVRSSGFVPYPLYKPFWKGSHNPTFLGDSSQPAMNH